MSPIDSELPILRYIFVNHVRNFPFLDKAREKEFWQDKLQVFLASFATKHISSSEDRLEETKRRKLAIKCHKMVELMMVSGIPTASGYEERIRFSEMEVVDDKPIEQGLLVNEPEGHRINGWDVNVAGVRTTSVKRTVRYHQHAEFLIRVSRMGEKDRYIGRRYGDFVKLHKRLRTEMPGKVLAPLPRKNKSTTTGQFLTVTGVKGGDDDASSISSVSSQSTTHSQNVGVATPRDSQGGVRNMLGLGQSRNPSRQSLSGGSGRTSPRGSGEFKREDVKLYREDQRVSLRAFLRTFLQNPEIADSAAMADFLTSNPLRPNEEEMIDIERRKEMDQKRIEEQKQFYEIARRRAAELDVYMEQFRRDIVESNGLTKLFKEIRTKNTIQELSPQYQKFAEWLRIEVAATIYHLFLAEDNSPELYAQAKRIHSLLPYTLLKNVIRIANPAAVMSGVLDLFLAQPFGSRSLLQRIFSSTLQDGIRTSQKSIDQLVDKIKDPVLSKKLKAFVDSDEHVKEELRNEAEDEQVDLIVTILRSEYFKPELTGEQIGRVFNAYVAWNNAIDNVDEELKEGAQMFAYLKQLLKLQTRQRDKAMMAQMIEEPTTLQLFRDLFTIFYEPLIRVYKSANVYNSISDFAVFADDAIQVIDKAQRQDVSADPNQTVQSFIDLCARHEHNFYKFVHEVHIHDNGLFEALMGWLEGILEFLRKGPRSGAKLDMNALFRGACDVNQVDKEKTVQEIDDLIKWQEAKKRWHQDKTRQKMAAEGNGSVSPQPPGATTFKSSDFGLDEVSQTLLYLESTPADMRPQMDLQDLNMEDDSSEEDEQADDELDPIVAERKRRTKAQDRLRRTAGEPVKPEVVEVTKMQEGFMSMLRMVLAE